MQPFGASDTSTATPTTPGATTTPVPGTGATEATGVEEYPPVAAIFFFLCFLGFTA